MSCKVKHETALLNSRDFLITQGAIDKVSNIKSLDRFNEANTQMSEDALNAYGVEGNLWNNKSGRAVPNHSVLKSIDEKRKELGLYDKKEAGTFGGVKVKEGVDFVFEQNPELNKIGTKQDYSQYLDTVFPESKVKDIVFNVSNVENKVFDKNKSISGAFYFATTPRLSFGNIIYPAVLNILNPEFVPSSASENLNKDTTLSIQNKGIDAWIGSETLENIKVGEDYTTLLEDTSKKGFDRFDTQEIVVFEPEQIHILGANKDLQMFKEWMSKSIPESLEVEDYLDSERVSYFEYEDYSQQDAIDERRSVQEINNYEVATQVEYSFKVVDAITNNLSKINQWSKQLKEDALYDKIQKDLQIPKDQMNLLKESKGNTIEEKISSFIANYSYAVEINIAQKDVIDPNDPSSYDDLYGTPPEERRQLIQNKGKTSTQYYSNLTVPGGTNYTENEILTPAITPSIKGHAQFASDKGIGWFRSDDKLDSVLQWGVYTPENKLLAKFKTQQEAKEFNNKRKDNDWNQVAYVDTNIKNTKTRRILELQSDLFQKGRGKDVLINSLKVVDNPESQNQFLQLLNKDNNWVTFFIKSIIQDSQKKSYEKVLFPTGNTASKIEGHTTLEEFKKQKEDRIKEIEKNKNEVDQNLSSFNNEKWRGFTKKEWYTEFERETIQLKQELERVETEGFGALKPIYNFYENVVSNILKKQFGKEKVKSIKDEYGNTWNELTLKELAAPTIDGRPLNVENFDKYLPEFSYATEFEKQLIIDSIYSGDILISCKI